MKLRQPFNYNDVTAIVLAMTDSEQPFLLDTLKSVCQDPCIAQVIICIEKNNSWIDTTLSQLQQPLSINIMRLNLAPSGSIRNQAVCEAKMQWIAFCDGDDIWYKGKMLQRIYAEETGCDFVGTDNYLVDENGCVRAFALGRYMPCLSSWMVRTSVMKKFRFDDTLPMAVDSKWWYHTEGKIKKARYPKILLKYRVRHCSVSSNTSSKRRKLMIISLSSIPVFGMGIYVLTYFIWLLNRKHQYAWKKSFGIRPASENMTLKPFQLKPNKRFLPGSLSGSQPVFYYQSVLLLLQSIRKKVFQ